MTTKLTGTRVVITGASSGFGMETARVLVAAGCQVVLGARREGRLREICDELGETATFLATDVTSMTQVSALVDKCKTAFGGVDALVNNAGIMPLSMIKSGKVSEWDQMIDVNIKGVLYGTNAVFNHFLKQGHGKIVNVSSIAGKIVMPGSSVYSATKFAVNAISEGTRKESAGVIQVTCIMPGIFATELANTITDDAVMETLKHLDMATVARPAAEVAESIKFALEQD